MYKAVTKNAQMNGISKPWYLNLTNIGSNLSFLSRRIIEDFHTNVSNTIISHDISIEDAATYVFVWWIWIFSFSLFPFFFFFVRNLTSVMVCSTVHESCKCISLLVHLYNDDLGTQKVVTWVDHSFFVMRHFNQRLSLFHSFVHKKYHFYIMAMFYKFGRYLITIISQLE